MIALLPLRVMVEDAWDQVSLDLPAATSIVEAKRRALSLTHVIDDPSHYVVKYRGAEIFDEQRTLAESGVVGNSTLIVLSRRRRPVR
jgi:hypothetical protein